MIDRLIQAENDGLSIDYKKERKKERRKERNE